MQNVSDKSYEVKALGCNIRIPFITDKSEKRKSYTWVREDSKSVTLELEHELLETGWFDRYLADHKRYVDERVEKSVYRKKSEQFDLVKLEVRYSDNKKSSYLRVIKSSTNEYIVFITVNGFIEGEDVNMDCLDYPGISWGPPLFTTIAD